MNLSPQGGVDRVHSHYRERYCPLLLPYPGLPYSLSMSGFIQNFSCPLVNTLSLNL